MVANHKTNLQKYSHAGDIADTIMVSLTDVYYLAADVDPIIAELDRLKAREADWRELCLSRETLCDELKTLVKFYGGDIENCGAASIDGAMNTRARIYSLGKSTAELQNKLGI